MDDYLTAGELRHLLEQYPDDLLVFSEGCDCTEVAGGVEKQFSLHNPSDFDEEHPLEGLVITRA